MHFQNLSNGTSKSRVFYSLWFFPPKKGKICKQILNSNGMHDIVFKGYSIRYLQLWNVSKMDWWTERGMDNCVIKHVC